MKLQDSDKVILDLSQATTTLCDTSLPVDCLSFKHTWNTTRIDAIWQAVTSPECVSNFCMWTGPMDHTKTDDLHCVWQIFLIIPDTKCVVQKVVEAVRRKHHWATSGLVRTNPCCEPTLWSNPLNFILISNGDPEFPKITNMAGCILGWTDSKDTQCIEKKNHFTGWCSHDFEGELKQDDAYCIILSDYTGIIKIPLTINLDTNATSYRLNLSNQ